MSIVSGFHTNYLSPGNYSTFEDAHERDQQHRAELAQRQHDKQDKMEKQVKEMEQLDRSICENFREPVRTRLDFLTILLGRGSSCILFLLVCSMEAQAA